MPEIRTGCADLPPRTSPARYFSGKGALDFLETTLCAREVPSQKVLRKWADAAPAGGYALVAPAGLLAARPPADLVAGFADAAATVDAAAVVFRTGTALTPGSSGRDALKRLFAEVAPAERFPGRDRVWHPGPLWELDASARFARELGVVCAVDPLAEDPGVDLGPALIAHLERGVGYLRPSGIGHRRAQLSPDDLESIAGLATSIPRAYCVFANLDAQASARAFGRLVAALAAAGDDDEPDDDDELPDDDDDDEDVDDEPDDDDEDAGGADGDRD